MTEIRRTARHPTTAASARASALRWVQRWHEAGSELRLALEDALVEFDPDAFLATLDRAESDLNPTHYRMGKRIGLRWQQLARPS